MSDKLATLVRLHRWRLDEQRRLLVDASKQLAAAEDRVRALDEEVAREQHVAGGAPEDNRFYGAHAPAASGDMHPRPTAYGASAPAAFDSASAPATLDSAFAPATLDSASAPAALDGTSAPAAFYGAYAQAVVVRRRQAVHAVTEARTVVDERRAALTAAWRSLRTIELAEESRRAQQAAEVARRERLQADEIAVIAHARADMLRRDAATVPNDATAVATLARADPATR